LRRHEEGAVAGLHELAEPPGPGAIGRQRDPVAVRDELAGPRPIAVATAEGRVHPHETTPWLEQPAVAEAFRAPLVRRYPRRALRRAGDIEIEAGRHRLEDVIRRV